MKHSHYGASSANRWLNCPGSINLIKEIPVAPTSDYAKEGTKAHKLAELCLNDNKNPADFMSLKPEILIELFGDDEAISEDMVEAVSVYVDYVRERSSKTTTKMYTEVRFDLDHIHQGMFGTNDCCVVDEFLDTLEVIDYKHGQGISVSPEENEQLRYYGLGAALKHNLPAQGKVILTIVQPRAMGEAIKRWETTAGYLYDFALELQEGIKRTKVKNPELKEGGWCKFCPAFAVCPQIQATALATAQAEFSQGELILSDPQELFESKKLNISKVLAIAPLVASWFKAAEQYAFALASSGEKIEGYKLVKKRANKVWKYDEDELVRIFTEANNGRIDKLNWYSEPKFKSPAQMEKNFGKDFVANLCETPDNGNTLVSISDKRPEVLVETLEFEAIDSDFRE